MRRAVVLLAGLALAASAPLRATARITIINANAPGVGLNDPTPATPVGGNDGTTIGQQRLIAFQYAADFWSTLLSSDVEIRIQASFVPLPCSATSGVLGSAGPIKIFSDFPNAQHAGTWYPVALANKRAGQDLSPGDPNTNNDDIRARFNSDLGKTGCLETASWYYGLDNDHGTKIDLVNTVLHEFGHGLGFLTLVSLDTGENLQGMPDVFERRMFDTTTNRYWIEMTDAERRVSVTNARHVVWTGPNVTAAAATKLVRGVPSLNVTGPVDAAGELLIGTASFGPPVSAAAISGRLVQALDPADTAGPSTTDACSALTNAPEVAGKIAFVDRGTCTFVTKAKNVQAAGAIAMVVADNVEGSPPGGMGGSDSTITIPSVRITKADGDRLRPLLASGVDVALQLDMTRLAGADSRGRVYLYATNPVISGSSINHWDTIANPSLLMEPFDTPDLTRGVDLTLPSLLDIGWGLVDDRDITPDRVPGSHLSQSRAGKPVNPR